MGYMGRVLGNTGVHGGVLGHMWGTWVEYWGTCGGHGGVLGYMQGSGFPVARGQPKDRWASQSHIMAGPVGQP